VQRRFARITAAIDLAAPENRTGLRSFDDRVTASLHGFAGVVPDSRGQQGQRSRGPRTMQRHPGLRRRAHGQAGAARRWSAC